MNSLISGREGGRREGRTPHIRLTNTDTLLLPGFCPHQPGLGPPEESQLPAGGDRQHHHQAEAGAAGQGQHRGDSPAADQDEDVHESHNQEPHDGSTS